MIYEIAGLTVAMEPRFDRLRNQSKGYQSSGTPALHIRPNLEDEAYVAMTVASEEDREYICCSAAFCRDIVPWGRFFLHASAIVCEGEAYLFAGPSGTGKSTHTALWRQLFPESYILNDDKPVIWPEQDNITVWGTPFAGKTNLQVNRGVPLKAICFLKQDSENQIQPVQEEQAIALLLNNTWRPKQDDRMHQLLDMLEQVITRVPIYEMRCTSEPEAAVLSYNVMKGCNLDETEREII